ncbi:MAG: NifU family protein [Patescibacteria group bacterium]|nr:NifU family protein [Patescibacteria group bacterium]MDD5490706.1 NifU family protein [Patescibacteria group bacterium]
MDTKVKILEALNVLRPTLEADGGDIEFVSFDKKTGVVKVKLIGACQGCPLATVTLKNHVEKYLKKEVPEVKEVIQV